MQGDCQFHLVLKDRHAVVFIQLQTFWLQGGQPTLWPYMSQSLIGMVGLCSLQMW